MAHECPNCGAELTPKDSPIKQNHPRTGDTYTTCPKCDAEWRLIESSTSGPGTSFVIAGRLDELP